jgi:hypothetical protein
MKLIYDEILGKPLDWRGEEYLVLGKPGALEPHQHLLDVNDSPQPEYDPATHALVHTQHRMVGNAWIDDWETRPLTEDEHAARAQSDLIAMAYAAAGEAFASMTKGKQALWEPTRQKVGGYILTGDFASIAETLQTMPILYPGADDDRDVFLGLLAQFHAP